VVSSPNAGTQGNQLAGVIALSAIDVWAVGARFTGSIYRTLTEHWNGSAWSVVTSPNKGTDTNELHAVAAVSTDNVWAFGSFADSTGRPHAHRTLKRHQVEDRGAPRAHCRGRLPVGRSGVERERRVGGRVRLKRFGPPDGG